MLPSYLELRVLLRTIPAVGRYTSLWAQGWGPVFLPGCWQGWLSSPRGHSWVLATWPIVPKGSLLFRSQQISLSDTSSAFKGPAQDNLPLPELRVSSLMTQSQEWTLYLLDPHIFKRRGLYGGMPHRVDAMGHARVLPTTVLGTHWSEWKEKEGNGSQCWVLQCWSPYFMSFYLHVAEHSTFDWVGGVGVSVMAAGKCKGHTQG